MFATHVDPRDLVNACTCLSALQSAVSAFYPKLATGPTAAQWGQTLTKVTTQQKTEHTNHSATEAAKWLVCYTTLLNLNTLILLHFFGLVFILFKLFS